jgi:hypothetical protein
MCVPRRQPSQPTHSDTFCLLPWTPCSLPASSSSGVIRRWSSSGIASRRLSRSIHIPIRPKRSGHSSRSTPRSRSSLPPNNHSSFSESLSNPASSNNRRSSCILIVNFDDNDDEQDEALFFVMKPADDRIPPPAPTPRLARKRTLAYAYPALQVKESEFEMKCNL